MDVYRQAAEIVECVKNGSGTAKALCLRKEVQKKKQTYAVVCETLRYYELLKDVLDMAQFWENYPRTSKSLAMVMCYDQVIGKGVNTNNDTTARAIRQSSAYLREAYWRVEKHHVVPPRVKDDNGIEVLREGEEINDPSSVPSPASYSSGRSIHYNVLPRYARVNTLKIQKKVLLERLERAREGARKREREDDPNNNGKKTRKVLPVFHEDALIPDLLVFPSGTDLHAHPAVRTGQLILQDRASCLPAAVLLDVLPSRLSFEEKNRSPLEYVVDACAAPGNKTTHLAALGAEQGIKIMAIERDAPRAKLLENRVHTLGASDYVNVMCMDFFDLTSGDREATEAILLDPSCSASGVMTRVDVVVAKQQQERSQKQLKELSSQPTKSIDSFGSHVEKNRQNYSKNNSMYAQERCTSDEGVEDIKVTSAEDAVGEKDENAVLEERVMKLGRLQRKLLAHSLLSFDNCRTVVYSTCSIHVEENENVVREVLLDERVIKRGWTLTNILPNKNQWKTRGIKDENSISLEYTIRCDPTVDATNGFFVARFDRPTPGKK